MNTSISIIVTLLFSFASYAQDLKGKIINNELCYTLTEQKQLDQALKVGVDCQLKLVQKRDCIKSQEVCIKEDHKRLLPQIIALTLGSLLVGFTVGLTQ